MGKPPQPQIANSLREYLCGVLRFAFRGAPEQTHAMIFLFIIASGALGWWLPWLKWLVVFLGINFDVAGWESGLATLLLVIFVRLVIAPYWLYKDIRRKFDNMHTQWADLAISGPTSTTHPKKVHWNISVCNNGPATADKVTVRLLDITPRPRAAHWHHLFPLFVKRFGHSREIATPDCSIVKGQTENYEFARTWVNGSGGQVIAGLEGDDKNIDLDPDERWNLTYEVSAANGGVEKIRMVVFGKNGNAVFEKID